MKKIIEAYIHMANDCDADVFGLLEKLEDVKIVRCWFDVTFTNGSHNFSFYNKESQKIYCVWL